MARVIDAEVKQILKTTEDTTAFITAAAQIVNRVLAGADYSEAELKEFERWMAAHLTCMMDPRETEIKAGTALARFEGDSATGEMLGLNSSRYGKQLLLMDSTGRFANLGKRRATVTVGARQENPPVDE